MPISIGDTLLIGGVDGPVNKYINGISLGDVQVWASDPRTDLFAETQSVLPPTWAYWADYVILPAGGGGGAGEGGLSRSGIGGYTGTWLTGTFIVPSSSLGLTLGAGGIGGQSEGGGKGAPGSSGGTTSINGPGGLIASAPGGRGGEGANSGGSGQNGKTISPQTLSAFGETFAAGSGGTGNAGTGGIGAGGAGGNGGIFGSFTKGGTGGPARIWLRWRSY